MTIYDKDSAFSKGRIKVLKNNFLKLGSTNKSEVIRVSAKKLGLKVNSLTTFYYDMCRQGVVFFQLSEDNGTKYPVNTKNVLRTKDSGEDKDYLLKLALSKLSKEDLADIILNSRK